jgi:hypothetical protein
LQQSVETPKTCTERLVIEPDKKRIADVFLILLAFVTTIWSAYFAAFGFPVDDLSMDVTESVIEVAFVIDIILNFLVKFNDRKNHTVVSDLKKIAKRYIKSMFIFDLLATFPFRHVMFLEDDPETRNKNQLLFLFKFLRWPKLMILFDPKNFHGLVKGVFKMRLDRVNRNEN